MRTTVDISEEQHRMLSALAQRRGIRGFSPLVREALDAYLNDLDSEEIDLLLGLEGALDDTEERELRARIEESRAGWRAS